MGIEIDEFDESAYLEEVEHCLETKILDPEHESTPKYIIKVTINFWLIIFSKTILFCDYSSSLKVCMRMWWENAPSPVLPLFFRWKCLQISNNILKFFMLYTFLWVVAIMSKHLFTQKVFKNMTMLFLVCWVAYFPN